MDNSNNSEKYQTISTSNHQKAKRLKILQELEDRKLQLNHNRLSKEQNKICKQLDFQRSQFTRRFSESNFNLSNEELSPKLSKKIENVTFDSKKLKQLKHQHSLLTDENLKSYCRLYSHDDNNNHDDDIGKTSTNQPFWLRLRSLGVPSDEDTLLAALTCKNMNIDEKEAPDVDDAEDDVFESVSKPSIVNRHSTGRISRNLLKQRSTSLTGADETFENLLNNNNNISNNTNNEKRIKRSLSLEDKKPDWLLALNRMKREKLSRLNSNAQEEITALVSGNKFYGTKRPNVLTVKYQSRKDRLMKSHRHTVVGITHEFAPI
ncbi:unnamed protein product [Schistosoma turkestanicum]|nr:unnamed protein product [Schistosoma turkestanicum]